MSTASMTAHHPTGFHLCGSAPSIATAAAIDDDECPDGKE